MRNASANQQLTMLATIEREVCLRGVMNIARVSGKSDLDTGEAGDGKSNARIDVAIAMATEATPMAVETLRATKVDLTERNENRKRRTTSEALATTMAPSIWWSRMERTMR